MKNYIYRNEKRQRETGIPHFTLKTLFLSRKVFYVGVDRLFSSRIKSLEMRPCSFFKLNSLFTIASPKQVQINYSIG